MLAIDVRKLATFDGLDYCAAIIISPFIISHIMLSRLLDVKYVYSSLKGSGCSGVIENRVKKDFAVIDPASSEPWR